MGSKFKDYMKYCLMKLFRTDKGALEFKRQHYLWVFFSDLFLLVIVFLAAEIALRIVAPQPVHRILRNVYEVTSEGFRYKPGSQAICNNGFGDHVFSVNNWYARDKEYGPKKTDEKEWRILCLGDSFSDNQGLDVENIYPNVLESELSKLSPDTVFSVVNGGMAGWGLWKYHDYLTEMIQKIEPDVVVIAFASATDMIERLEHPPRRAFKILAGLPVRKEASLLARLRWSFWYLNEWVEEHSHAYILFRRATRYPGIWLGITKEPSFSPLISDPGYADKIYMPTLKLLKAIKTVCDQEGVKLAILNVPRIYEVYPSTARLKIELERPNLALLNLSRPIRILAKITEYLDIPMYDPTDDLAGSQEQTYFPAYAHWNEQGNRVVAEGLRQFLERENLIENANDQPLNDQL